MKCLFLKISLKLLTVKVLSVSMLLTSTTFFFFFKELHVQAFTNILNEVTYVVDIRAFGKADISPLFPPRAPCIGL